MSHEDFYTKYIHNTHIYMLKYWGKLLHVVNTAIGKYSYFCGSNVYILWTHRLFLNPGN